MRRKLQTFGLLAGLMVSVLSFSGCFWLFFGAAAGASGYAWANGSLTQEFEVSASRLHDATVKALKKLDLPINEDEYDRVSALVRSEFADGKDVKVVISAVTERSAKATVRVGLVGDKTKSEMIMSKIEDYL